MLATMGKKKRPRRDPEDKVGGRAKVKYLAVPEDLWDAMKAIAEDQHRSVNSVIRAAIREFLKRERE